MYSSKKRLIKTNQQKRTHLKRKQLQLNFKIEWIDCGKIFAHGINVMSF